MSLAPAEEGRQRADRWGIERLVPQLGERWRGLLTDGSRGTPLQKLPNPGDYAKAAAFLASDDAEIIAGFDLRIDAGAISRYWLWDPGAGAG